MNLQDTMMLYGVTLGKRRTNRQKALFRQQLCEDLEAAGMEVHHQEYNGRLYHLHNVVAGDLQKASVVFAVPYDTLTRAVWPGGYYPFHPQMTLRAERRDILVRLLLAVAAFGAAYACIAVGNGVPGWLAGVLLTVVGLAVLHGSSNRFNFNRSSAAVALAVRLAQDLGGKGGAAIAFCDRSASGYEGYRLLSQSLPDGARVVLLDSLAQGETLVLAHTLQAAGAAKQLQGLLPEPVVLRAYSAEQSKRNLLALFPAGMMLTSGAIRNKEFVVQGTRTPSDVGLNLPRLQKIEEALTAFAAQAYNEKE